MGSQQGEQIKSKGREMAYHTGLPTFPPAKKKPNLMVRSLVPSDNEEKNVNSSWLPEYASCLASKLQGATLNMV